MTHYEVLGVAESATPDEIKRSYRKLASVHHPDKGGDTARFQEIQVAYDTLIDQQRRIQYDAERRGGSGLHFHTNHGGPDVEDLFRSFGFHFGEDPFARFRQHTAKKNRDIRVDIQVTLASTLTDQTTTINIQTSNGTQQNVEVAIPRGIQQNATIKYPQLGDNFFETLARGDLYITVHLQPDDRFQIHGLDLLTWQITDCLTAMTGGPVTVTGADGRQFEINVPAGCQHDTGFRIPDQGLWQLHGSTRGSLIVKIKITIPQNLTPDQIQLINQIKHRP